MIEKIFLTEKLQDENPYEKLVNEIRSSPDYLNLILEASDPWILQDMNGFILDLSALQSSVMWNPSLHQYCF